MAALGVTSERFHSELFQKAIEKLFYSLYRFHFDFCENARKRPCVIV